MSTIVIMPGGFHPFHAGHAALYNSALRAFPGADVYVAATDDTTTRPFPFQIKEKLAQLAGVSKGRFMRVKSPFQAKEITAPYNPEKDRLIFVRSEKDANKPPQAGGVKKDGSPSYLQPLAGQTNIRPFKEHAYMAYLPTVEFGPGMTSATEIRTAWPKLNEKRKTALVMSLYPATQKNPALAANVVKMLDTAIGSDLTESGMLGHVMFRSKPPKLKKIQPAVSRTKDFMKKDFSLSEDVAEDAGQPTFHIDSYDNFETAFEVEMIIDNNNAGFFSYQYFPKTNDVENDVDIHSEQLRGQGLGKLLLLKAIETAEEHNLPFKPDRNGVTPEQGRVYKSLLRDGIIKLNPDKTITLTGRSLNEFAPAGGSGGDNYGGDLYDILMGYIQQTYPDLMDHFGQDTVDSTVSDMVVMGTFGDIDPSDEDDLEDAVSQIITQLEDSALDENQGWAATFTSEESGQMAGTPASTGMWAGYQRRENQPIDEDYIEEKWSQKYKRSINCSNPRGFSQKAHCAGRKK